MAAARKRDGASRITIPTPEELRARREAREQAQILKDAQARADDRAKARDPANWGPIDSDDAPVLATINAHKMAKPRPKSIYEKLLDDNIITQGQCKAGHHTVDIWARCNGLDGRNEKLMEFIDKGPSDPAAMTDRRIDAQIQWKRMLADVGGASGKLLYSLADCWILDSKEPWQDVVRRVYSRAADANADRDRKNLAMLIYAATENARMHFGF